MGKCPKCGGKLQLLSPMEREPRNPYGSYEKESQQHYAINDKPEKEKKVYRCLECSRIFELTDDQFEASDLSV
jgi:DNA-directed RNA polymerase subunit RPC12/RpoP